MTEPGVLTAQTVAFPARSVVPEPFASTLQEGGRATDRQQSSMLVGSWLPVPCAPGHLLSPFTPSATSGGSSRSWDVAVAVALVGWDTLGFGGGGLGLLPLLHVAAQGKDVTVQGSEHWHVSSQLAEIRKTFTPGPLCSWL